MDSNFTSEVSLGMLLLMIRSMFLERLELKFPCLRDLMQQGLCYGDLFWKRHGLRLPEVMRIIMDRMALR